MAIVGLETIEEGQHVAVIVLVEVIEGAVISIC